MSSNRSKGATGRVSSIRRRLANQRTRKKIGMYFSQSFFLVFVFFCTWYASKEYQICGNIAFENRSHYIICDEIEQKTDFRNVVNTVITSTKYVVADIPSETIIIEEYLFESLSWMILLSGGIFALNFCFALMAHPKESHRIKQEFKPLNEMALKVEELSKLSLTEDKYRLIEDKITSLEPDENNKLSFGDEDLAGIEGAMNNLLNRIRESNRQQARFVNDASHELRTPIAVIEGYANMLARWGREDEKVLDESITAIQNESAHMKHLVEQLLFLARGDAGRTELKPAKVDLREIMREVYEESLMIDENHIYRFNSPEESVEAMADEGLIKQAVRILVDNAAKYTNAKDEIILSVGVIAGNEGTVDENGLTSTNPRVFLQVQDTGIGMKDVDIEHMFERFYRADDARSFGGTGLGLSIAKWIVDKHGGYFEITSRPELGTRIRMVLP